MNSSDIVEKMVLGTAQFGMDYGIANLSGKPSKMEVFNILDLAWEKGIRSFDTAPGYDSEEILGEFILANGIQDEAIVLTKIASLEMLEDYEKAIKTSIESSLKNLDCNIDVLFFHDSKDSQLLLNEPWFFEELLHKYPVSTLGVSVYEPQEVESLLDYPLDLAIQFPFNVLDRRFEHVDMPHGKHYARSIFLQGLLVSPNGLRPEVPEGLLNLQKHYHEKMATHNFRPVDFAISFVANNNSVDYFLIGIDSVNQIEEILNTEIFNQQFTNMLNELSNHNTGKWLDPRKW